MYAPYHFEYILCWDCDRMRRLRCFKFKCVYFSLAFFVSLVLFSCVCFLIYIISIVLTVDHVRWVVDNMQARVAHTFDVPCNCQPLSFVRFRCPPNGPSSSASLSICARRCCDERKRIAYIKICQYCMMPIPHLRNSNCLPHWSNVVLTPSRVLNNDDDANAKLWKMKKKKGKDIENGLLSGKSAKKKSI